jgi:ATP-dependent DNA helicase PIF1
MTSQATFNCAHLTCQQATNSNLPFGGKSVILLGDFRQTCPVIRGGSRSETVEASIKRSPLWPLFHIHTLTTPIRHVSDPDFASFVDAIGDGLAPSVTLDNFNIVFTEHELIDFVYPPHVLAHPVSCTNRAILAPTNLQVDRYNSLILDMIPSEERIYYASDSIKETDEANLSQPLPILDYLAVKHLPGIPPYALRIKTNTYFRLLRNLSIDRGLVKNARVVIQHLGTRLITITPISNDSSVLSTEVLLPRITFPYDIPSSPYTLHRKQFALGACYATTFNGSQGLTLDRAGIDLTRSVFSHGQLYTALSRVRHRKDICLRLSPDVFQTANVTFSELLQ